MGNKFVVTGIGTDVGKTVVSSILAEALKANYWKPVQAGDLQRSDTIKVKEYTENEETTFVSLIPTFIQQAEQRIFRTVTIPEVRSNSTGTLTQGNQYLQRPDDFLAVFSFLGLTIIESK